MSFNHEPALAYRRFRSSTAISAATSSGQVASRVALRRSGSSPLHLQPRRSALGPSGIRGDWSALRRHESVLLSTAMREPTRATNSSNETRSRSRSWFL
jgi:hypothetical protein